MGATFTAKAGYKTKLTFGGDTIHVVGEASVGINKALLDVSTLGDGVVPFRTFVQGMTDPITMTVNVPWDPANDGVTECYTHHVAETTDTLIFYDEAAVTTLVSGSAFCNYRWLGAIDGVETMEVTFQYSGALTGTLVA